jgi:hypothetical protein
MKRKIYHFKSRIADRQSVKERAIKTTSCRGLPGDNQVKHKSEYLLARGKFKLTYEIEELLLAWKLEKSLSDSQITRSRAKRTNGNLGPRVKQQADFAIECIRTCGISLSRTKRPTDFFP